MATLRNMYCNSWQITR